MSTNQTFGRLSETTSAGLGACDALPPALRRIYVLAPYKFHMTSALSEWKRARAEGWTVAQFRKAKIAHICERMREEALACWGPDHPDAQRSRLERRT